MKVLFNTYPMAFATPGGGERQIMDLARELPSHGVTPLLYDLWSPQMEDADVVHFFSVMGGSLPFCEYVKSSGLPLIISPNLWITKNNQMNFAADEIGRQLELADRIVLNSVEEVGHYRKVFGFEERLFVVIPAFVANHFFVPTNAALAKDVLGILKPYVLSIGNLEPRKNQKVLIKAMRQFPDYRLVLVGHIRDEAYAEECLSITNEQVMYVGAIPRNSTLLRSLMAGATLFALPSLVESPSYAALETAAQGTPVVVTRVGNMQEYFGDRVTYVDPLDAEAVADGIRFSLANSLDSKALMDFMRAKFSSDRSLSRLVGTYREALGGA